MSGDYGDDLHPIPLVCPSCHHEHTTPIRVVAETPRRVTKRPITPELIHICPTCHGLAVLSLHPAGEGAKAAR
jgi:hypothetical protein